MPACSVLISSTQIYLGLYDGSLTCHCHFKKGGSLGRKQRDERKKNNPFVGLRARLFCRQQRDTKLLTSADVSSPTTRWSAWLGTLHWFTWGDGALLICFFPIFLLFKGHSEHSCLGSPVIKDTPESGCMLRISSSHVLWQLEGSVLCCSTVNYCCYHLLHCSVTPQEVSWWLFSC